MANLEFSHLADSAKLLSRPHNFAVVQLPERNFPGVVVQGDTLNAIIQDLQHALTSPDGSELIEDLVETLIDVRSSYEAVCDREEISLPYPKAGLGGDAEDTSSGSRAEENNSLNELILPDDFDDYAGEVERKGWFAHATVLKNGIRQDVTFYDPVRLQQDVELELTSGPVELDEPIIVVEAVTKENMEKAVAAMERRKTSV